MTEFLFWSRISNLPLVGGLLGGWGWGVGGAAAGVEGWAGAAGVAGLGWGWAGVDNPETEIGQSENGKVVSRPKNISFRLANSNNQFLFMFFLRV